MNFMIAFMFVSIINNNNTIVLIVLGVMIIYVF